MATYDPVTAPIHYAGDGKIECKHALKSMMTNADLPSDVSYWWGCAFKYLWRWPNKGGRQDIEKAIECLGYMLEAVDEDSTKPGRYHYMHDASEAPGVDKGSK